MLFRSIYSKLVIIIGFGIFYFEDLSQLGLFFKNITAVGAITGAASFFDPITWASFQNNLFLIAVSVACSLPLLPKIKSFFLESSQDSLYIAGRAGSLIACMGLLAIVSILLVDATNNVFLYWRF